MTETTARPDRGRLERRMAELARIGADGNGLSRLGLSLEERQAQDLVGSWLAALGGQIRRDAAIDMWCRFGGAGPAIVIGSHLDSVPHGGRYDGTLGVLCAVEALEVLIASDTRLTRPIEVVAWSNEEGRFGIGLFGSSATFGYLPSGALDRHDTGINVRDALAALGSSEPLTAARRSSGEMTAYIEPHIEQGPRLERQGLPLGIVSAIVGLVHGTVTLTGRQDHAGTTPMSERRDALSGAAEIALALERLAREHAPAVATVGQISVRPGAMNVIPGECAFSVDVRAPDQPTLDRVMDGLRAAVGRVAASRGLAAQLDVHDVVPPVPLDPDMRALLSRAASAVGVEAPEMTSGAGHDAANPQRAGVPTGMLFIRSTGGSHTPDEHASMDDAVLATRALVVAIREVMS